MVEAQRRAQQGTILGLPTSTRIATVAQKKQLLSKCKICVAGAAVGDVAHVLGWDGRRSYLHQLNLPSCPPFCNVPLYDVNRQQCCCIFQLFFRPARSRCVARCRLVVCWRSEVGETAEGEWSRGKQGVLGWCPRGFKCLQRIQGVEMMDRRMSGSLMDGNRNPSGPSRPTVFAAVFFFFSPTSIFFFAVCRDFDRR